MKKIILMSLLSIIGLPVTAENFEVQQINKTFSPLTLKVKQGDVVSFVNKDDFFHNVFSLSDAKLFDLGSYPKNESKTVTFDVKGVVDIECAIHPDMKMTITVE